MDLFLQGWTYFPSNILTVPAYFIGLIVLVGYVLLRKPWYEAFAGFIKATVGYMILGIGSGNLVNSFRPILVGLKDRFQLSAMVIDPYFGQNAVTEGLTEMGRSFSSVMCLLLFAFIFNIVLVAFRKVTKIRSIFTTGHVQMQQAAIAFWVVLFAFPDLQEMQYLIIMGIVLGTYWAVGSNLTVEYTQELTDGAGFCVANAVPIGFLFGAAGQFLAIISLILLKSPVLVIAGFVPVFFDNATIAVFSNSKGGFKAAMVMPFIAGLVQVYGSALFAHFIGLAVYGGYLGMFDWATIWPVIGVLMKYAGYIGVAISAIVLLAIPQIQ